MVKKQIGLRKVYDGTEEPKDKRIIVEEPDLEKANQLALSKEFCQPRYSDKRDCYILIRKKKV